MAKRNTTRVVANSVNDPTLPKTPVTIDGTEYNLCCDFGALAEAEAALNREMLRAGRPASVNLLFAMAEENLANTRTMFAAAVRKYHPDLSYDDALALVRADTLFLITIALRTAYVAAMPEKKADPTGAQPAE